MNNPTQDADAPYHAALRDLRNSTAVDLAETKHLKFIGYIDEHRFQMEIEGIKARYRRDAERLARQYGKAGHDGQ